MRGIDRDRPDFRQVQSVEMKRATSHDATDVLQHNEVSNVLAISRKFARTFETSLCWRTSVASWDVARFISTDCTWRKSGLSRSIPRIKVQAAVSFWYGRCCRKRRSTLSPAFAFLPGSRNFSPNSVLPWRNEKICRTKFIKIAAFVHVFTAAMKSLW